MSYTSRVYRQRNAHTHDERQKQPFFSKQYDTNKSNQKNAFFQAKLSVNKPGDSYEREADSVANAVVNNSSGIPVVQKKNISSIQRLSTPVEDEKLGTNDARMAKDKEIQEKPIQRASAEPEKEKMKGIQKKDEPMKEEEKMKGIQKKDEPKKEEEDNVNTPSVQTKQDTATNVASNGVSSKIENSSGKGNSLSSKTMREMSSSFGVDFSDVRIHNDLEAADMNKELQAQAFTHGSDIYFNSGKFNPENSEGKFLLAHELTHVVQQTGNTKIKRKIIQRYPSCSAAQDISVRDDHNRARKMLNVAIRKISSYDGATPSEVHDALSKHFNGSTSNAFATWINTNLRYLSAASNLARYECFTGGILESTWACTSPSVLATTFWCVPEFNIRLCPTYFGQSDIERSTTLIHEWVHKYGCNLDLGYEHEKDYGSNSTITQLGNADSFANLVRDVQ